MKVKNIFSLITASLIFLSFVSCKKKDEKDVLKIEITTDSEIYKVNDEIKLTFKIINISDKVVELCTTKKSSLAKFIRAGCFHDNQISYTFGSYAVDYENPEIKEASLMLLKPAEKLEGVMLFKINPIKRLTEIPYDTSKIFIELEIMPDDYPEEIQAFFEPATGNYKSNETAIKIDSTGYEKKYPQYLDVDYIVNYYKLVAANTDQFISRGFNFSSKDNIKKNELINENKYVKTFKSLAKKYIFFEFYSFDTLMTYAKVFYDKKGDITDFVIYNKAGLVDIRYEALKEDDGSSLRWDKYVVDFLKGIDIYLGYIKITLDDSGRMWIEELLMKGIDGKYKKFNYDISGKIINREEVMQPTGTLMRKRKF
jgi:hypothetical protein